MSQGFSVSLEMRREFVWEWFGEGPRSLGTPEQRLIEGPEAIYPYLEQRERPVWISVSTYNSDRTVRSFDRLFFDFDSPSLEDAWRDAHAFSENLRRLLDVQGLLVYSGKKGFHYYGFLEAPVNGLREAQLKELYRELQTMLIGGHTYPTLDRAVLGDVKRVARVPLSYHQGSGSLVVPLDGSRRFVLPLPGFMEGLRRCGIRGGLVELAQRRIERRRRAEFEERERKPCRARGYRDCRELRPCMEAVLNAADTHGPQQKLKVAACAEAFAKGWSEPEIIGKFAAMSGYDEKITRKQVESSRHYTPYKCVTIQQLGGCLPDCRRRSKPAPAERQRK